MHIKIILEPSEEGGYTAIVPALPGCISEGDSRREVIENIREATDFGCYAVSGCSYGSSQEV